MTKPDEQNPLADHEERLLRMMDQAHSLALYELETVKLRLGHYEKLAVLCVGTLALSFTAVTAFHPQQLKQLNDIPSLIHAWQLLLIAIVLSVVSNWLSVNGMTNLGNARFANQIGVHFSVVEQSLLKLNPEYARKERANWDPEAAKSTRRWKTANVMIRMGSVAGFVAQIVAFCAFVSLFFFAKAQLIS